MSQALKRSSCRQAKSSHEFISHLVHQIFKLLHIGMSSHLSKVTYLVLRRPKNTVKVVAFGLLCFPPIPLCATCTLLPLRDENLLTTGRRCQYSLFSRKQRRREPEPLGIKQTYLHSILLRIYRHSFKLWLVLQERPNPNDYFTLSFYCFHIAFLTSVHHLSSSRERFCSEEPGGETRSLIFLESFHSHFKVRLASCKDSTFDWLVVTIHLQIPSMSVAANTVLSAASAGKWDKRNRSRLPGQLVVLVCPLKKRGKTLFYSFPCVSRQIYSHNTPSFLKARFTGFEFFVETRDR